MRSHYPILSVRLPRELIADLDAAAVQMFSTYPRPVRRGERTRFVAHALREFLREHSPQAETTRKGA